jgi:hypothetical protein
VRREAPNHLPAGTDPFDSLRLQALADLLRELHEAPQQVKGVPAMCAEPADYLPSQVTEFQLRFFERSLWRDEGERVSGDRRRDGVALKVVKPDRRNAVGNEFHHVGARLVLRDQPRPGLDGGERLAAARAIVALGRCHVFDAVHGRSACTSSA